MWIGSEPFQVWTFREGIPNLSDVGTADYDVPPRDRWLVTYAIDLGLLITLQMTALALTVAAVVVLKERKA